MRSQKDPQFSSLCDRVGKGKTTEDDETFLRSRVKTCESESHNDSFKTGKLSIRISLKYLERC